MEKTEPAKWLWQQADSLIAISKKLTLERTLDQIKKKILSEALIQTDGKINNAKKMNLSFSSMRYRIQKYKLKGKVKDNEWYMPFRNNFFSTYFPTQ